MRAWAASTAFERARRPRVVRSADGCAVLESTSTDVGGRSVHARVALGAGDREIVLMHGVVVSSRYLAPLALELARDARVYAPDLVDPWWAIRTGTVPLWLKFAVEPSAARLERYLADAEPYDDVRVGLFSHGTDSLGVAPAERWRTILAGRGARAGRSRSQSSTSS